ncbi:MAG: VOC family protein [Iphinoe sp. HA4291-MV1]|jgi:predicted enzyme related to lactoylglutathione lyase|nr:VOC family protein [Iphinoe sp. HA4291-MV1]
MPVVTILNRVYVQDIDAALHFYQGLLGASVESRFRYPGVDVEIAKIGSLLLLSGSSESLQFFQRVQATFVVDSLEQVTSYLQQQGAVILRPPQQVPTGMNMIVKHPDGLIVEYVEPIKQRIGHHS